MSEPNIVAYAQDGSLGLSVTDWNIKRTQGFGWTTIVLAHFHFNQGDTIHKTGDTIHWGNTLIIDKGNVVADLKTWQDRLSGLKHGLPPPHRQIKNIYASIGGAAVRDFTTIRDVYNNNNNKSFENTTLKKNLVTLREHLPAINGIDMNNEEWPNNDWESFVAFCKLVHDLGWDITFCATGEKEHHDPWFTCWIESLTEIEKSNWGKGAVKWLNLQMYGATSSIKVWVDAIKEKKLGDKFTDNFIVPGFFSRYWQDTEKGGLWEGACPAGIKENIIERKKNAKASVGGAFIWNLDYVWETAYNPGGCPPAGADQGDYINAIIEGLQA